MGDLAIFPAQPFSYHVAGSNHVFYSVALLSIFGSGFQAPLYSHFDSQACIGLFSKGRSSSKRMNRICRKCSSLCLAADLVVMFSWTNSDSMPMDKDSRRFEHLRIKRERGGLLPPEDVLNT